MTTEELAAAVQEVRTLQKRYFKERTRTLLEASKEAEANLDKLLSEILNPTPNNQTSLF